MNIFRWFSTGVLPLICSSFVSGAILDPVAVSPTSHSGLNGVFYKINAALDDVASNDSYVQANQLAPTTTFTLTDLDFSILSDSHTLLEFLNGQGSNFSGASPSAVTVGTSYFIFTGYLVVDQPGTWNFQLGSDDGAAFYLNNTLVVQNDYTHLYQNATNQATFSAAGSYALQVKFFENSGVLGLRLSADKSGNSNFSTLNNGDYLQDTDVLEPATFVLFGSSSLLLLLRRKRKNS